MLKNLIKILIISIFISILYYNLKSCNFYKYKILRIESGSMQNTLQIGDIIIIKKCNNYNVGDIITFCEDNKYLVTHRIIRKEGKKFITKGDNNNVEDNKKIDKSNIKGKVICNSKILKCIYNYWYVFSIVIIILVIFL